MTDLAMGANAEIASQEFVLDVRLPRAVVIDISALQLQQNGKVRSDSDMCFFNQPSIGAGAITLSVDGDDQSFSFNLNKVENNVERIVVNATLENGQFGGVSDLTISTSFGVSMVIETSDRLESALILCEIYRRNGQWKIRNVSQGFNGGLQALAEHFGVKVDVPSDDTSNVVHTSNANETSNANNTSSTSAAELSPAREPQTRTEPDSVHSDVPASVPSISSSAEVRSTTATESQVSPNPVPAFFSRMKQSASEASLRLSSEASKFRNRAFMEAVVNGCVLVAAADGSIDGAEKKKMAGFIERSDELKHFGMGEVIDVFLKAAAEYESDSVLGKAVALEKIRKIKANKDQAKLLVRVVSAIGAADGDFDTQEKEMVSEIARELGLNPADFNV